MTPRLKALPIKTAMKKSPWTIYSIFKDWKKSSELLKEPVTTSHSFSAQEINLEPVFEIQTHHLKAVFCAQFLHITSKVLAKQLHELIETIRYWHCHNLAIRCIIPIAGNVMSSNDAVDEICEIIQASELPVGMIAFALSNIDDHPHALRSLEKFQCVGIEIDLFEFSDNDSFEWFENYSFSGIHLSTQQIRSSEQLAQQAYFLEKIKRLQTRYKFHIYFRGIALVHDFVFAKKHQFDFCYGPLMMPAVSKYQILKIKESQFAHMPLISTPSTLNQDG